MKKLCSISTVLAYLGALSFTAPASAMVIWDWTTHSGQEVGTFQTNGTTANLAGPFNFTIDAASFTVTTSTLEPGLVGATFIENQPTQGFLWNGTHPTQFYRASGSFVNGSNFLNVASNLRFTFGLSGSNLISILQNPTTFNPFYQGDLTLAPQTTGGGSNVPEPATLSLFAIGAAGVAASRRRKAGRDL